ncbi:four helix bundle protein [Owenweeksia hongkongensis]|uniref:S23 ribosomal protein n=1 Tax=Owenweeksia hongkongensis (strain DSM 17368 / CIP 108786 / JCM 12287 / NRRL B-23963 / UST20020801) TaxID=926562 RepID=G8R383_OWEHD|nr:four helix bundle protein [Owenweeksia hongkongensis]AEV34108.1 S23 ribosomal protein [Owenweeksia hongkongensis DSM 17368]
MGFKFEKLIAWQKALGLSADIHELTLNFPQDEKYILTSQIKRAADSINLNIAEGSTGQTNKQFSVFLGYAIRSGIEVIACLHTAKKRGLIDLENFNKNYDRTEEVIKITQGLRNSLRNGDQSVD